MAPPVTLPIQVRNIEIPTIGSLEERKIDTESRTIEFTFSSDHAIRRDYGWEVLDHGPSAIRTERLRESGPVLLNHDWSRQIGVVLKTWVKDNRGHVQAKFSRSAEAQDIFQDVVDGIRRNISVGYIVHELTPDRRSNEPDSWRVTDWEPVEVSLVAVPADYTVGVDRTGQKDFAVRILEPNPPPPMAKQPADDNGNANGATENQSAADIQVLREQTRADETKRIKAIYATGQRFQAADEAEIFVRDGKSLEEFEHVMLEKLGVKAKPLAQSPANISDQMTQKERGTYSIVKVIRELSNIEGGCRLTGLELEVSQTIERDMQSLPQEARRNRSGGLSAYIPMDLRMPTPGRNWTIPNVQRDMNVSITANSGAELVAETFIPSLIEYLRNALIVQSAGATVLSGLQGMVVIPKQVGTITATWYTETAPIVPTDMLTSQIALQPRRLGASTIYSRQLVIQSSLDIEALVRSDLARSMAEEIDRTALFGDPAANPSSPRGVFLSTDPPLPAVPIDPLDVVAQITFGTAPTVYEDWISFVTALDNKNVPMTRCAYIGNPSVWGSAIATPTFAGGSIPIYNGNILGYPFYRTNQIPSTGPWANRVVFGDWSQLLIGQWAGIELIVDPYTFAANSQIRLVTNQFADMNLRYRKAFAVSTNAGALLMKQDEKGKVDRPEEGDKPAEPGKTPPPGFPKPGDPKQPDREENGRRGR